MTEISTSENKITKTTVSDWDTDFFNRFSLLRNNFQPASRAIVPGVEGRVGRGSVCMWSVIV